MRYLPAIIVAALVAGCGQEQAEGPPQVRYGHAECAECGMIVSHERYAAAMVLPKGEPNRELIFDDINCMVEYDAARSLDTSTRRYVHDVESLKWLTTEEATFIRNPEVHTPMGSGLQAFAQVSSTMTGTTYDGLRAAAARVASETATGR